MIAVFGATGRTGGLVARQLRRRGPSATLCGRDAGRLRDAAGGRDVDCGPTAVTAVEIARRMTAAGLDGAGVLAPAQVVDPAAFLGFPGEHGVSHRVGGQAPEGRRARA